MADKGGAAKVLSVQDWEQLMSEFRISTDLQRKWLNLWPGLSLVEHALQTITRKEFAIKAQLLVFIEENSEVLLGSDIAPGMGTILDHLRSVLQAPVDGVIIISSLKEHMMVMATTVAIVSDVLHSALEKLEVLVELFLVYINRPNHTPDRQLRGLACDCLRELEMAYPCLLYSCVGQVHLLCMNERTHVGQNYILLLTTIMENLSCKMYTERSKSNNYLPILQSAAPLVPYSVPFFLVKSTPGKEVASIPARDLTPGNLKEFRKVVAFLWERPQLLTTVGMLEFVSSLIKIYKSLGLSGSLLKHHFSSLLHSYSPVLCHIVLSIYSNFIESFDGDEGAILRRLISLSRENSQSLPFRLLGVHWLLGIDALHSRQRKLSILAPFAKGLYPQVFDPLSLKAAKLGALAQCAVAIDKQKASVEANGNTDVEINSSSKMLTEVLLSVSSYTWLPPWSTETRLAFHIFHRFLTVAVPHSRSKAHSTDLATFTQSSLFQTLQGIFVDLATKKRKLVPSILALLDRLMACEVHRKLGETLLRAFNEKLLPILKADSHLPSYFPLLENIAENSDIPPGALVEKLTVYIKKKVEESGPDDDCLVWGRAVQVLGICRTVLLHHRSSRCFHTLGQLLGFLCLYFPDVEVRDTARLYLRMLISIPGNRLRGILNYGDERVEEASAPQLSTFSSFLRSPSPPSYQGHRQSPLVAAYIHLRRVTALLVRHSWSLVLYDVFQAKSTGALDEQTGDSSGASKKIVVKKDKDKDKDGDGSATDALVPVGGPLVVPQGRSKSSALRVMDSRTSEIILTLRTHFGEIPDFLSGPGLKISVPCSLVFQGDTRHKVLGDSEPSSSSSPEGLVASSSPFSSLSDSWPAIYAVVITFSTTGLYGPIPKVRVPFLLSEPPEKSRQSPVKRSSSVSDSDRKGKVKSRIEDNGHLLKDVGDADAALVVAGAAAAEPAPTFHELVVLRLEPRQPVPTLVDAYVVFSDEDGHGVQGRLDSVPIGIEDLFVKPPLPADVVSPEGEREYLLALYHALWEACSGPGRLGTETFSLQGGLNEVVIEGSESVKLIEAQVDRVVGAVEHHLARFVVAVNGDSLAAMTKDGGMSNDVVWEDVGSPVKSPGGGGSEVGSPQKNANNQLALQFDPRDPNFGPPDESSNNGLGNFLVLIFLPPRYHLLMRMEVADYSTLVRIRTDYWPCLAHVDEFLEALTTAR
ncbi:AP-5 complex subunit beta-1 [Marchantia polymorpha subsp. ruderalis]